MSEETKQIDDGGPAFPCEKDRPITDTEGRVVEWNSSYMHLDGWMHSGMSRRDYFAGQALIGLLAYSPTDPPPRGDYHTNNSPEGVAEDAYQYADAMIAASKKEGAS